MTYSIDLWGSDRRLGADDRITGEDGIGTEAEALRRFRELSTDPRFRTGWERGYVDGPDGPVMETTNPHLVREVDGPDGEFAMQQGMAHGVDAFNEANGDAVDDPSAGSAPGP